MGVGVCEITRFSTEIKAIYPNSPFPKLMPFYIVTYAREASKAANQQLSPFNTSLEENPFSLSDVGLYVISAKKTDDHIPSGEGPIKVTNVFFILVVLARCRKPDNSCPQCTFQHCHYG
jgi:hypothetical protein